MATKRKRKRGVVNPPDLTDLVDLPGVVSAKRRNIIEPDNNDDDDVSRLLEINGFNESIVSAFKGK